MRRFLVLPMVLAVACSKPLPPPPPEPVVTGADVTFVSTPPGAKVELDGLPLDGVTPLTQHLEVGKGDRKARFLLPGYEPTVASFLVPLAPYTLSVTLTPGQPVKVSSTPAGAAVRVDGQPALAATPGEVSLATGPHELELTLGGMVPVRRHLDADQRQPVDVRLVPAAFVSVSSDPPGAEVWLDGVSTGKVTPCADLPVAAQRPHQVSAKLDKLRSPPTPLKKLRAGSHTTVALKLRDQDHADLLARRAQLQKQLLALKAQQRVYEKKTQAFVVTDARKARDDEQRLDEISDEVDQLSSDLADVEEQLRGDR